jgi:hypothetical protein
MDTAGAVIASQAAAAVGTWAAAAVVVAMLAAAAVVMLVAAVTLVAVVAMLAVVVVAAMPRAVVDMLAAVMPVVVDMLVVDMAAVVGTLVVAATAAGITKQRASQNHDAQQRLSGEAYQLRRFALTNWFPEQCPAAPLYVNDGSVSPRNLLSEFVSNRKSAAWFCDVHPT